MPARFSGAKRWELNYTKFEENIHVDQSSTLPDFFRF